MDTIIAVQVSMMKSILTDLKNKTKTNPKYAKLADEIDGLFQKILTLTESKTTIPENDITKSIMEITIPLMCLVKKIEAS
jgi:hypothetical protein